ncbi:MAG: hypothetical protein ACLP0A_04275 [Verrucomicrobiia bacterium]
MKRWGAVETTGPWERAESTRGLRSPAAPPHQHLGKDHRIPKAKIEINKASTSLF